MKEAKNTASRRTFLKAAGAAAFVAKVPMIIADDKPLDKNPVIGEGQYKYECIHGWAKLPEGMKFGNTHMVQEDAQGRIFIHHQNGAPDSVFIFDADGKFIKSWGKEWRGGAHGMQMRKEGTEEFLYLATTGQGRIVKTNLNGDVVFNNGYPQDAKDAAGKPCYDAGKGFVPTNIAFGPNGDFYVADGYGKNFIHQYNIKGEWIRTWGGGGNKDGLMSCNHGIFTDTRSGEPKLLVADRANERLQYFSLDGKHLATIKPGPENNPYRHPCHFDQRGDVLVCPGLKGRVSILDKENKVIAILGDNPDTKLSGTNGVGPEKRKPGIFVSPHGATFDRAGNIYITEWVSDGRVIKLRPVA